LSASILLAKDKRRKRPFGYLKLSKKNPRMVRIPKKIVDELDTMNIAWEPDARVVLLFNPEDKPEDILRGLKVLMEHFKVKYGVCDQ